MNQNILKSIVFNIIKNNPKSEKELFNLARIEAGKFKLPSPEKSSLLATYRKLLKTGVIKQNKLLEQLLTKRAVRTMSGVAVISVLTKPFPCPGKCIFCPTEKNMPKSYLSNEPAVMRAIINNFDPYRQVTMRLKALKNNGHATDKIELIIMGGTWSYHSPQYQKWFIKRCFDALNNYQAKTLTEAQKKNETAKHRCVGLTLETRPDYISNKEIKKMRELGCTRVELGIQHLDDKILKINRRGHSVKQSIKAIKLLKDAGFKINLHLMLNLYGSNVKRDFKMFQQLYSNGNFMPDMIKIYPCVVNEHAYLYKLYKQKKYKPYTEKQLEELIKKIKKITPPWVRITRLIRDIPEESIIAGNKKTNLRQLLQEQAKQEGWSCQCIRCREAGHQSKQMQKIKLNKIKYQANDGIEYFLSFESFDKKVLYAFLRLRFPSNPQKPSLKELKDAALIREVHTYGQLTNLGEKGNVQHLGLGKKLLAEAEKISQQYGYKKIAVIAGIGVRQYYQKNGYHLERTYMIKNLK